nr:hypothetical protein [uncultured Fluviicola sp.]
MKITYFILLAFLFSGVNNLSLAQEPNFSAELPEVREVFVGASNDKMIYYKEDVNLMTNSKLVEYIVVNTANPEEKKTIFKSKPEFSKRTQVVFDRMFVQGDFIYEIHQIHDYNSVVAVGIVKRELATLNQVGKVLELNDFDASFAKSDEDGFYFFSKMNLYRIDLDLNLIWTKKYEMFEDYNVVLNNIEVDDNLNVLMSVAIKENVKVKFFGSTPPAKSSLLFIITDLTGEPHVISPEIPQSVYSKYARFNYNDKKKELEGLFLTSKESNVGIGYLYIKWNNEGEIIVTDNHNFSFQEFVDDDMKKYAESAKFKTEKYDFKQLGLGYTSHIRFLDNGNVLYISHALIGFLGELEGSKLIFMLSPEGKLLWTKMIPLNSDVMYKNGDFYIEDAKLHVLIMDYSKEYETGGYVFTPVNSHTPLTGKTVLMAERIIDLETGKEISNKPLIANPSEKFYPTAVIYNKDKKIIVRYSYTVKNRERFLTINY